LRRQAQVIVETKNRGDTERSHLVIAFPSTVVRACSRDMVEARVADGFGTRETAG
jgi:hypothetical protein